MLILPPYITQNNGLIMDKGFPPTPALKGGERGDERGVGGRNGTSHWLNLVQFTRLAYI